MLFIENTTYTPIIIRPTCKDCGHTIEARIVTAEYLQELLVRPQPNKTMYA